MKVKLLFREDENYKFYELEVKGIEGYARKCRRIGGEDMEKPRALQADELPRGIEFIEKGVG